MLDKLKIQLQEVLKNLAPKFDELRNKIPLSFLKKNKGEEENLEVNESEEVQESGSSSSEQDEVSANDATQASSSDVEETNGQADSTEQVDLKQKNSKLLTQSEKKKKFVRIAIISIVLIYFVVDHFLPSSNESGIEQVDPVAQAKIEEQKKKNKEAKEAAQKEKEAKLAKENIEQQVPKIEDAPATETTSITATDPVESVTPTADSEKNEIVATENTTPSMAETPSVPEMAATNDTAASSTTSVTESSVAVSSDQVGSPPVATDNNAAGSSSAAATMEENSNASTSNDSLADASADPAPASIASGAEGSPAALSQNLGEGASAKLEAKKDDSQKDENINNTLGSKIEESTVDYTKAEYNVIGRGLVYNCKGKHWACVARDSWFKCKNNEKWTSANNKDKECKTVDVYASEDDCRIVQINNINTRKETSFCK